MSTVTLMITVQVKNFADWKVAFDSSKAVRDEAKIKVLDIYQSVENENLVTVVEEAESEQSARSFLAGLKTAMEKSGVTIAPEIKILRKA